ncbi:MAG: DegT/DnrJ/EryC1/StrS family aminotransferase [Chloroflexota bacterium]|nr:DegT/DnrJ/EryC1/StrS family aminotransferase [Chloroflexota bacterium]MDE3102611.1 DegT/DnrJ/EryC1/StrS family aminotransferase [Chloroflexota bacterium]
MGTSALVTPKVRIPWGRPTVGEQETRYVAEALRSTWISGGAFVERLESDFAAFLGVRHALAVSNGTAALHVAYMAVGIGAGDEVILPALTFPSCAAMVLACGATPVFVDCDAATLGIDPAGTANAIGARTRAIVPAHLFGSVCDLAPLLETAHDTGVALIEDAAEAFGARYDDVPVGSIGTVGCFSLHAAKTVTAGEGGVVVTNDDDIATRVRLLRSHGFGPGRHYWSQIPGFNYRLTNLQAAIACAQLERVASILETRRRIGARYRELLCRIPGVRSQSVPGRARMSLWVQAIVLEPDRFPQGPDAVRASLLERGIETRPMFEPIYKLPAYERYAVSCPVAEHTAAWGLSLPVFEEMTDGDVVEVCTALGELVS